MPVHSTPPMATLETWSAKREAANGKLWVDCGFWGGVTPGDVRELALLWRAGVLGFHCSAGIGADELRSAMVELAKLDAPLLVHFDSARLDGAPVETYAGYLAATPVEAEVAAIRDVIAAARSTGARVHVLSVSCGEAAQLARDAQQSGVRVSAGTNPHYLYFAAEEIADGATAFQCAPPIRGRDQRDALWNSLSDGALGLIASGHSPVPKEKKQGGYAEAWPGVAGLQVALAAVWTARRPSFDNIAKWMSEEPARLAGLGDRKGRIAPGYDADFVVWNPQHKWMLMPQDLHHRHKMTPYIGSQLQGEVEATFVRGVKVFQGGQFSQSPAGRMIERNAR